MNKGLLKIALLSVVCGSIPVAFTSCKDYDDDIDRLNKEVAENKSAIDNISQQVSQGGVIKSVAPTADGKGIVITVEVNGKTENYTIKNGENGKDATIWTIDADGYWCENGVRTNYKAVGEKGEPGAPGTPGTPGATGNPGDYYKPNAEGYFDLYTWDAAKGEYILKQKNAISYATANDHVTAVETANDVFLYGIEGSEGVIVLAKTGALRSLVFKPDFYYQGIEAMDAATFKFPALKVNAVNADGNFAGDKPTVGNEVSMTPALVANYYLNPSSANIDNIFDLSFITEDLKYVRSSSVTAQIFDREVQNGILKVKANLQGDIKAIAEDEMVTVLALQARLNEKAAAADTVITSDYAAVKASYYTDIDLAVPANVPGVVLNNPAKPNHWWTTAEEAINADPALQIAWNNDQGLDISRYIQADYTNASGNHVAWSKPVKDYGFKYEYALVGYVDGNNNTSQSAHAALNPANNAIVRAQMPTERGLAQPWGAAQNKASLGRMPLVRVCLVDTVTASRPVAAVAYVKLEIVEPGAVAPEDAITPVNFDFGKAYTVSCSTSPEVFTLTWAQIEAKVLAALNMSKATFERNYELRLDTKTTTEPDDAQQVTITSSNAIVEVPAGQERGVVTKKPDPTLPQGTEVISWSLPANFVYEYFTGTTKPKDISVVIVYDGKPGTAYAKNHVAITLKWTPSPLNVNPSASVNDESKIAELWFTYNSPTSAANGGLKQETHLNVAVPVGSFTDDSKCTFTNSLLYPFVGNKVGMSGLDATTYPAYVNTKTTFAFIPVENAPRTVKGMSGAQYTLLAEGAELKAKLGVKEETIAKIDNNTVVNGVNNPNITFQESVFAKDILNYRGAQQLSEGETLSATIGISATNQCDKKLVLSNEKYNVRFLRPVTTEMKGNPVLRDGVDDGSSMQVANYLSFKDWRNIAFTDANKYLTYYGVDGVVVGELDPINGTVQVATASDITTYVTTDLNGGNINSTKLSSILPDIKLTYTPASPISLTNIGTLTYYNAGNVLGYAFNIRVPFVVQYKWGFVECFLTIKIDPTIGQGGNNNN